MTTSSPAYRERSGVVRGAARDHLRRLREERIAAKMAAETSAAAAKLAAAPGPEPEAIAQTTAQARPAAPEPASPAATGNRVALSPRMTRLLQEKQAGAAPLPEAPAASSLPEETAEDVGPEPEEQGEALEFTAALAEMPEPTVTPEPPMASDDTVEAVPEPEPEESAAADPLACDDAPAPQDIAEEEVAQAPEVAEPPLQDDCAAHTGTAAPEDAGPQADGEEVEISLAEEALAEAEPVQDPPAADLSEPSDAAPDPGSEDAPMPACPPQDEATPATADGDLDRLPGAGPGLIWMLNECDIRTLDDLAAADRDRLTQRMGLVGRILDLGGWIDFARAARN